MKYIVIGLLLLTNTAAWANNEIKQLFEQANNQYLKGEYREAVETYEKIVRRGFEAPELYFNLANAYYKNKNLPAAILNYERAQRLAPNNKDILFNLELSNLQIVDRIEPAPELFFAQWWNNLSATFSSNTWAVLVIILVNAVFLVAAAFFILRTSRARKLIFLTGITLLLVTAFTLSLAVTQTRQQRRANAIIFSPVIYMKSSPDEKSENVVSIREGNKVTVLDKVGEWRKVQLINGSTGWIPAKALRMI